MDKRRKLLDKLERAGKEVISAFIEEGFNFLDIELMKRLGEIDSELDAIIIEVIDNYNPDLTKEN